MEAQALIPIGKLVRVIDDLGETIGTGILTDSLDQMTPTETEIFPQVTIWWHFTAVFEILFTPFPGQAAPAGLFLFPTNLFTIVPVEEVNTDD